VAWSSQSGWLPLGGLGNYGGDAFLTTVISRGGLGFGRPVTVLRGYEVAVSCYWVVVLVACLRRAAFCPEQARW